MARYKTYKIEKTPTDKFTEMVTISKKIKGEIAVSYTHLTLPTILLV